MIAKAIAHVIRENTANVLVFLGSVVAMTIIGIFATVGVVVANDDDNHAPNIAEDGYIDHNGDVVHVDEVCSNGQ